MVELTDELIGYMRKFQEQFGDIVPLRELPQSITVEQLIEVIKKSLACKENKIAEFFQLEELEKNKNIEI